MNPRHSILIVLLILLLTACTTPEIRDALEPPPPPEPVVGSVFVFQCPGEGPRFTAQITPDTAWLFFPEKTLALGRAESASGAKFAGEDTVFWNKGGEASLEMDGKTWTACASQPSEAVWEAARLRGVTFRALGNEPGWYLEIQPEERLELVTDYGERKRAFLPQKPIEDPVTGVITWRADGPTGDIRVDLRDETCTDTTSGESFERSVTVRLNEETYQGCGRWLVPAQ